MWMPLKINFPSEDPREKLNYAQSQLVSARTIQKIIEKDNGIRNAYALSVPMMTQELLENTCYAVVVRTDTKVPTLERVVNANPWPAKKDQLPLLKKIFPECDIEKIGIIKNQYEDILGPCDVLTAGDAHDIWKRMHVSRPLSLAQRKAHWLNEFRNRGDIWQQVASNLVMMHPHLADKPKYKP